MNRFIPDAKRRGFTLLELLVVIAIIGVLSSILLPSLARAKAQAHSTICQSNTRQLILGCLMYCDDNRGFFPYNMASYDAQTNVNWASDILDWDTNSDNTNLALVTRSSSLGAYVANAASVFHCPADSVLSGIQRSLGWGNRARSYSMNASIGDAGDITSSGYNTNNPNYVQFFKTTTVPKASQIFVFMDEHPDTISDGYFLNIAYSYQWIRLPASYHNRSANVSFADGHAELHHWRYNTTTPPSEPDGAASVLFTNLPAGQRDDYLWVIKHMTVKSN